MDVSDDSFYTGRRTRCLPLTRSDAICTKKDTREQPNLHSAFIDGGALYGSDPDTAGKLRTFSDGTMKTHRLGPTLPTRREAGLEGDDQESLVGGDTRATVQPGLTSLYSLFLNEHNRVAQELKAIDSSLDDEELYQRARIIVTAELQNIVYTEFLPALVGPETMREFDLQLPGDSKKNTYYYAGTNPGISNEFATVAFRFGHALIPNSLTISNYPEQRTDDSHCPLKDNFFNTEDYILGSDQSGKSWQNVLVGSGQTDSQQADSITNFLFCKYCGLDRGYGQDLFARNIMRGRDHGLPDYTMFRRLSVLTVPTGWSTRPQEISQQTWDKLRTVYTNVEDIDPYVGGVAERPVKGGVVGPTFAYIIGQQFQKIKEGDRFFFTHKQAGSKGVLTEGLRAMIRKRTLHDLMCDNIPIDELPLNIFNTSSEKVKCSENNKLNFITAIKCLQCAGDKSETNDCTGLPCPGNECNLNIQKTFNKISFIKLMELGASGLVGVSAAEIAEENIRDGPGSVMTPRHPWVAVSVQALTGRNEAVIHRTALWC